MKTVFILEDEAGIQEVLELLLSSLNYNVICYSNTKEFYRRDIAILPDLFILDVMLPDGLGTEVCRKLKSDFSTCHIPVLMMSAHMKIRDLGDPNGPNDFISKPFDLNEFISKITELINQNEAN